MTVPASQIDTSPAPVSPEVDPQASLSAGETIVSDSEIVTPPVNPNTGITVKTKSAQQQQNRSTQLNQSNNFDWRVKLSLAPNANYLYKSSDAATGILYPLQATNGVIFPYTPEISTAYRAKYSEYDLTHSNYRGYFYQNSYTDTVNIKGTFTAQSTEEANYLLAVIHFFRSVTKMFYGQDTNAGAPPPIVFLSGYGNFQFNNHPLLVTQFNYTLPADVDYIRARSSSQLNVNLNSLRAVQSTTTAANPISASLSRLAAAFTTKGALNPAASPNTLGSTTTGTATPTYVPTKIDINLTLLPVQSRAQVSQQFSFGKFANGDLLRGGFW